MKRTLFALFLLCMILTLFLVSCNDSWGSELSELSSDGDFSNILSQDSENQHNTDLLPWDIPEDIENPSQGLELAETYSKEFGDAYIVVGIGTCEDADIVIPSTVDGKPVVEIADSAFFGNNDIKSVYCGNRVTEIGKFAFQECKKLKKVIIPDSVTSLKEQAFAVSGVEDLTMSDRITIMERAVFLDCDSLESIKLPYSLMVLTQETFQSCDLLKDVKIGPNVTTIERDVFASTALKTIRLPASVQSVNATAFNNTQLSSFEVDEDSAYYCTLDGVLYSKDLSILIAYPQLRGNYTIPDGVKMIDTNAFYNINYEVTLPDSMRTISETAFFGKHRDTYIINIKKGVSFIENYAFTCFESRVMINFEGTEDEWNAIKKEEYWYAPYGGYGNQSTIVKCSDGNLTFNYTMQLG